MDPVTPPPDFVVPADEDWEAMDDDTVYWAAQDGVPEAVAELARRSQQNG